MEKYKHQPMIYERLKIISMQQQKEKMSQNSHNSNVTEALYLLINAPGT